MEGDSAPEGRPIEISGRPDRNLGKIAMDRSRSWGGRGLGGCAAKEWIAKFVLRSAPHVRRKRKEQPHRVRACEVRRETCVDGRWEGVVVARLGVEPPRIRRRWET